jgi:hypothetical protein
MSNKPEMTAQDTATHALNRIGQALERLQITADQLAGNPDDVSWGTAASLLGLAASLERLTHEDEGEALYPFLDALRPLSVRPGAF